MNTFYYKSHETCPQRLVNTLHESRTRAILLGTWRRYAWRLETDQIRTAGRTTRLLNAQTITTVRIPLISFSTCTQSSIKVCQALSSGKSLSTVWLLGDKEASLPEVVSELSMLETESARTQAVSRRGSIGLRCCEHARTNAHAHMRKGFG